MNDKKWSGRFRRWRHKAGLCLLLAAGIGVLILTTASAVQMAGHEYVMTDGMRQQTVRLYPGTVEQACEKAGFDNLTIVSQRESGDKTYLQLSNMLYAQIHMAGETLSIPFTPCTVRELLQTNGIILQENDTVVPALDTRLTASVEITIVSVEYRTVTENEEVDFAIETRETDELAKGKKRITQAGVKGEKEVTYSVTLHDGQEVKREVLSERMLAEPINCITERGTGKGTAETALPETQAPAEAEKPEETEKPTDPVDSEKKDENSTPAGSTASLSTAGREAIWSSPTQIVDDPEQKTITTKDGTVLSYSRAISVKATAYHRLEEGGLITASGTITKYGSVAVDPRVIPLGSRVFVVAEDGQSWSYGPGVAEDTGGLIKGNKIDLFFMTSTEAVNFGVRSARIYILTG